jgi:hypothetical protein
VLRVEIDEPDSIGRVGRASEVVAHAQQTVVEALTHLTPAVQKVLAHVRGMFESPNKVQVQFGVKMSAEAGIVVAKAATEANFTVTVEWVGDSRS